MTRAAFLERTHRYSRAQGAAGLVFVIIFAVSCLLGVSSYEAQDDVAILWGQYAADVAPAVAAGAPLLLGLVIVTIASVAGTKRHRIDCPHCEATLVHSTSIVIASGNCPRCGGRVIDDADAPRANQAT